MAQNGTRKRKKAKRKGWWTRFLERMARANQESLKNRSCPT